MIPDLASPDGPALISFWASTLVMVLLGIGLYHRHRRRVHIPIMLSCFVVDLVNVLFIEFQREAVEKAFTTATRGGEWILKFHIGVSVLVIVGYFLAMWSGLSILKGKDRWKLHLGNAVFFMASRTLNFITSFWVVGS